MPLYTLFTGDMFAAVHSVIGELPSCPVREDDGIRVGIPCYSEVAMAYIAFVLKLLFGLDDKMDRYRRSL